jgi:hypothetical protein
VKCNLVTNDELSKVYLHAVILCRPFQARVMFHAHQTRCESSGVMDAVSRCAES